MKELTQGLLGLGPLRKSAGYTQERFAEALGVTRSLLAAWEVGVTWPSSRWLPKMADLLDCELDDLYRAAEEFRREQAPALRSADAEGGGSDGAEVC